MKTKLFLFAILFFTTFSGCDSTKGHDFEGKDLPEPAIVYDKIIYDTGELKVGSLITFTVVFPPDWRDKKKWTVWDGTFTYICYDDTLRYKPKYSGNMIVLAAGFKGDSFPLNSRLWQKDISE